MNPEIYRQYDSRWGDLPYPGWGAYLSDSGCGCLAVYHCAIELKKYAGSLTVPQCRDYMVQFATVDDGTLWSGITRGLEHYGFTVHWRESDTMDDIFRELSDSCNCGVILFAKKNAASYGPDGTLWTTIGHYIAFTDYKIENGEHKFYMKDSGPRNHDGWYSFEKSMRGCCRNVWICKSTNGQERYNPDDPKPDPEPTPTPTGDTYPGPYPEVKKYLEPGDKGENVIRLQNYLNWYTDGAFFKECGNADGVYGNNTLKYVNKMLTDFFGASEADGLVGPKTIAKMKAYKKPGSPDPKPTPRPDVYPGNYPVVKKYLEPGDRGENVIRLQQYLDWYYNGAFSKECGGPDGVYGANTLRWVKKMQTEFFGASEADGLVGSKTIAEMKRRGGASPEPAPTNYTNVIDVSSAQSAIDWNKVKADGIVGVMVRCGYRGYEYGILKEDSMFMSHIKGASAAGLKLGIYFYTQAINYKEGQEEADYAIGLLNKSGVTTYYPIAIDSEYCPPEEPGDKPRANDLTKAQRTQAIKGFCDRITERGGEAMIYANLSDLRNSMDLSQLPFDIWCAQWDTDKCQFEDNLKMWQYTSKGRVNGVAGNVDRNRCYISKACPQPSPTPPKPDPEPQPTPDKKSYSGSYPTAAEIKTASNTGIHIRTCNYARDAANSGKYHYVRFTDDEYTHECPLCHPRTYDLGGNCIWVPFFCWHHGGKIPCACSCGVIYNGLGDKYVNWSDADVLASMKDRIGVKDLQLIRNGNKKIPATWLEKGDALMFYYNDGTYKHMGIYVGNGKIADCTSGRDPNFKYGASYSTYNNSTPCLFAIRYTGGFSYLQKDDQGDAVTKLQNYLDWYFDGAFFKECGGADGIFGKNTHNWVVKMQTDFFGAAEADGTVGPKTIEKMKAVVK